MNTTAQYNASLVWDIFQKILQIPRPSSKEEKMMAFLEDFAQAHQFTTRRDKAGNLVMVRPGKQPAIALQGHTDMVCEKNAGVDHDFEKDPIQTYVEDGWMHAKGTTLGADNGIGVAMALAALLEYKGDRQLEGLFTVQEETGLTGADAVTADFISARMLLNLDSEDENELIIGCAGGCETSAYFEKKMEPVPAGQFFIELMVHGLLGGHSGSDIHLHRANANLLLGNFLQRVSEKYPVRLCSLQGGNLHNAIPREAKAVIAIETSHKHDIRIDWNTYIAEMEEEWLADEPQMRLDLSSTAAQTEAFSADLAKGLLQAITTCPHGVIAMDEKVAGAVKTSTNLASVKMTEEQIIINTSQRSTQEAELSALAFQIYQGFEAAGAKAAIYNQYPGWEPKLDSPLLDQAVQAYQDIFQKKPAVKVIHAGLECGLFYRNNPALDMLSFGPTMMGVHSPDEKLEIASVEKIYPYLMDLLDRLS